MVVELRTARDLHIPHSLLRFGDDNGWTLVDRLLALALTVHEDGLHSCGHPRSLAFEDYNEGIFEVRDEVCQACAAVDLWRQEQDGKKQKPGSTVGVANTLRPGENFRIWRGSASQDRVESNGGEGHTHEANEHRGLGHPPTLTDATEHH